MDYIKTKTTADLRKMVAEINEVSALHKATIEAIYAELLERYGKTFQQELAEAGKQDGEMTRDIDGQRLTFAIKAKVKWDSGKLQEVAATMDPSLVYKVFKIEFSVPERTFKAMTDDKLVKQLTEARTVEYTNPKIVFSN